jgi:hypothetical protein
MDDTTPTIYCTRTNRLIDTCLPGQVGPEAKLARHMKDYGSDLVVLPFGEAAGVDLGLGHASLGSTSAYLNIDKKRALDIGRRYGL